jgi:transposase-like protein
MGSITREAGSVNLKGLFAAELSKVQRELVERLGAALGEGLDANIDQLLGRRAYVRRREVGPWVELPAVCHRCKSRQSQRFSRNGHRNHTVVTLWGEVTVAVQRLVCVCGGSVQLAMDGWLRPYQRIGDDVDEQIRRWGALRVSLREMQAELAHLHLSPLALRTLNVRLQQVAIMSTASAPVAAPAVAPPVLQVDAIWVTQLVPTGTYHRDAKGRWRPDKKRIKRPIFIALGVWPETGQAAVVAWHLAAKEDESGWLAFLSELEASGVRGENGLELIIHDGGAGLCAALNIIHFAAAEQRCLFHKLRNLYHAIRVDDENLPRKEQQRRRKAIFRDFHHIWQAKQLATVLRRYRQVVRLYRTTQPEAIRCLRLDFRSTIAYFSVQARHPGWHFSHLRTTSRLERFNRSIRRRTRAASAYHSDTTLRAMLHHEVKLFNSGKPPI